MKLIPTGDALNFLSQAAPRAWVHRFLRWMALNEGLKVYARQGRVQPYCMAGEFHVRHQAETGEFSGTKMDDLIRKNYDPHIADQIVGKAMHDRVDDEANVWTEGDELVEVDPGFFLFSEELDWVSGNLKATAIDGYGDTFELFFWDQADHLGTSLPRASYDAEMSGLNFEFSEIELLLPSSVLQQSLDFIGAAKIQHSHIGRPPRWDWEGAMMFVIAEAQKPDGLPTGHGAQARVEEMISAWFTRETGDCPAPSQVRQRAAKIMRTLEKPETPQT